MKIFLSILLILHGLIHLMGFAKAFDLATMDQLTQKISKVHGIIWLITTILLMGTGLLVFFKKNEWWVLAILGLLTSQYLIMTSWQDARFGTIANVIILLLVLSAWLKWIYL